MQAKHIKGTISLCAALIAGVALFAASGAGAAKPQAVTKIDVSTKATVVHYLRSIHVNPKGVVIQRGARNYAGPNCPGKHWTCAGTRHTVVQIAKRGGQNRFVCKSSKCVVVQISGASHGVYAFGGRLASTAAPNNGGGNSGVCVKSGSGATTGTGQTCTINQSGSGLNTAVVYENTQKVSGLTQTAQYSASITQTSSGSVGNKACVTQNINLDGSTTNMNGKPTMVNLQAYQSVTINQDAAAGANSAQYAADSTGACTSATLTQSQTLTSTVTATGSITQYENQPAPPKGANVNIDIEQNQSSGFKCTTPSTCPSSATNNANFQQTMNQQAVANTPKGPVIQTQSSPDVLPNYSGLVGTVNQDSNNKSTAITTQNETQCEDAATGGLTTCHTAPGDADFNGTYELTQTQYGPEGVFKAPARHQGRVPFAHKGYGQAIQTGGTGDTFTINQHSQQDADLFNNQHNTQEADCSTPGTCTVNQTVIIDGNQTGPVTNSGQDLTGITIECTGSDCTQSPPPPAGPICNASSDTNAAYNDMPTDVVNCLNPAIGFQATSTNEFGDEVGLAASAGRTLDSLKVDFQSFGCQSGSWNSDPAPCSSAANATFQWPITANIYAVADCDGTPCPGALLATTTPTQTIPYRPSADNTGHCTGDVANKWFNPLAPGGGACQNSIGKVLTFTFPAGTTLPDQVIWTVAFNTSTHGYQPAGTTAICTASGGCPYDSLNVGDKTYGAPYAGTDVDENTVALSTGTSPLALVTSATDWFGLRPLGEILVAPVG